MSTRTGAAVLLAMIGIVLSGYALNLAADGVTLAAYLNYVGLALQLAGFGTVAWGLADLRATFTDRPSLATRVSGRLAHVRATVGVRVRELLRRPVHATARPVRVEGAVGFASDVTAKVSYGQLDLDRPVSELIAQLDARTRESQDRINRLQREQGAETAARKSGDASERQARESADAGLDRKLADLAGGGLGLEWWGVWIFLAGTVLSTIPDELASWIS